MYSNSILGFMFGGQVEDFNAFTAPLAELGDALPLEVHHRWVKLAIPVVFQMMMRR